ncbi:sporulation transcriptional regulator SpoIIID, partial [bacterium]|nr:sporulation transcriptional regulator SpoIIID [bacterium]
VQGICTAITGYELLGAFLYSAMFVILFVNKFFTTNTKKKLLILIGIWVLTIFCLLPISYTRFFTELIISVFFTTFYAYIYKKTEDILSVFIPTKKSFDSNNTLPNQGEEIFLKDYNLTERQIILLKDFIENKSTYIKLSKKYNISISTVKKDMAVIFTKFNVANNNELFILLSQFIVR